MRRFKSVVRSPLLQLILITQLIGTRSLLGRREEELRNWSFLSTRHILSWNSSSRRFLMRCWSISRRPRCRQLKHFQLLFKRKKDHFKNLVVERAFLSVQGLARAPFLKDAVRSVSSIRDLLKFRWPGVLAWLCYFYVGCFEKNLGRRGVQGRNGAMAERSVYSID